MKRYWKLIAGGLIVIIAIVVIKTVGSRSADDTKRQNIPLVRVEQPHRETVVYKLEFQGDVLPIQQASIFSKVSGNLDRVYVDMGTSVRQDQLLALIDTTELYQTYQQNAATYENARSTYERNKELSEQNLVAKQDLDNSAAAMKVAKANFETAQTHLQYARITAPFSGIITKRFLDPGALVNQSNSTLFTLMDLDEAKIVINILEKNIPSVKNGTKAIITVDAFPGKEFIGAVARFSGAVDLATRTMAVEIDVPNRDHLLKPGMFANVSLIVDEHPNAVTVPTQAILSDGRGSYVYIENNKTAERRDVALGIEQTSRTEVLSGLAGTENIITTGQQLVRAGGPVSIQ